jgi:two-component system, chemotaxis family, sensor kinase CheA
VTDVDAEFIEIFRDEARERLDRIVETLLALESGSAPADAVDSLFRDTHTIKGAAGMVGLDEIGELAHAMEDILATMRETGSFQIELTEPLLRAADALRQHVEGSGAPVATIVEQLSAGAPVTLREAAEPEPEPKPTATSTTKPLTERRSIRVPAEKIDTLLDLVGETVLHRRRLEHALEDRSDQTRRVVSDELDAGGRLLDGLKDAAIGMRTLPLGSIVGPLPRVVRDLAIETGKEVELVIDGADTELDRVILEGLSELLVHILRNAVSHGIELPEERQRLGKPTRGRLELRAEQRGGIVEIVVADDGRGVTEETLAKAQQTGSLTDLLTQPGFSTANEVSEISGRGVGLDAVKKQVESHGGSIEVRSEPRQGTEIVLRLPLALALLEVLLVERAGNVYGVPLASVEEAIAVGETLSLEGRPALALRGVSIPVADLAELLGETATPPDPHGPAIVLQASGRRVAAVCDALLGKDEVVVKSLGPLLSTLTTYLGAAILGDGRIALLVDPVAVVQATGRRRTAPPVRSATVPGGAVETHKILVVEDSLAVRELQRSILEAAGYRVETARDGSDALELLGRDETIELVVTDVDMPEMNGFELTAAIRAHPSYAALPVIVVTSRGEEEDRRRGIEAGADAYMVKRGFDQQVLLETVERLVGP